VEHNVAEEVEDAQRAGRLERRSQQRADLAAQGAEDAGQQAGEAVDVARARGRGRLWCSGFRSR
jgi:hypothetical protein